MPLKFVVDDINEVPEPFRGEYTAKDGKFHLGVEGLEDTTGLKAALAAERKSAKDLAAKVKRWEALGKTDDEVAQLLRDHEDAETKKAAAEGDHTKILKQHQDKWAREKADLDAELNAARASERSAIIETSIMAALTKAAVTEEGSDLLPDRLAGRIKFEMNDGKRVIKIMQADGETPMAGNGPGGTATFDDLVKEAAAKWPSLFKGSGKSGSGTPPNGGGGGAANADLLKLSPAARLTEARKRGITART